MTKALAKNSKKGFTLVELVVVIAILAILAAIAIPVVTSVINVGAKNVALSNARTIEGAVKECQSHIITRNGEVYPKITEGKHTEITTKEVAETKGITGAFKAVGYDGELYLPYWDKMNDRCIFLTSSDPTKGKELKSGKPYNVEAKYCVVLITKVNSDTPAIATDTARICNL
ncbi:MAG: prepilin-type N-terminal cleavage/methylation domain-containing protein [Acutalibacteraceae bacterium]|nr:prepilin-type N-terminal cleavage/methylation domain-containing protein [Acutalibacteraceae bacterium]